MFSANLKNCILLTILLLVSYSTQKYISLTALAFKYRQREKDVINNPWYCGVYGYYALRYKFGRVECYSNDGEKCYEACKYKSRKAKLTSSSDKDYPDPVKCGKSDYEDEKGWCKKGLRLIPKEENKEWKCNVHYYGAFRYKDGNTECWAYDGKNCDWTVCYSTNKWKLLSGEPKPLTCSDYSDKNHWCYKSISKLTPIDPKESGPEWQCGVVPGNKAIRWNNNNIECFGYYGNSCDENACTDKIKERLTTNKSNPLACGDSHKKLFGVTGYESNSHWCSIGRKEIASNVVTPTGLRVERYWQCGVVDNKAVKINYSGHIECFSEDGKTCKFVNCGSSDSLLDLKLDVIKNISKPLACNDSNYSNSSHWCSQAREWFRFAQSDKNTSCSITFYDKAGFGDSRDDQLVKCEFDRENSICQGKYTLPNDLRHDSEGLKPSCNCDLRLYGDGAMFKITRSYRNALYSFDIKDYKKDGLYTKEARWKDNIEEVQYWCYKN